jgi:hypothetical protein
MMPPPRVGRPLPAGGIAQLVAQHAADLRAAGFSEAGAGVAAALLGRLLRRVRLGPRPPPRGALPTTNGNGQPR